MITDSEFYTKHSLEIMDANHMHPFESSPFATITHNYDFFSNQDLDNFPSHAEIPMNNFPFPFDDSSPLDLEELDLILGGKLDDISGWIKGTELEGSFEHFIEVISAVSTEASITEENFIHPLILPTEEMVLEINDNKVSLSHLTKGYVEAMENKQAELAEVIKGRISEKVDPINGEIRERLLYHSFRPIFDKQADYLKQESLKNFDKALEAFYQILPYGLVAHFTANSTILESMPCDAEVLHLVDFDMGEGIQWASMIMALGQQNCGQILKPTNTTLRITSIKWKEQDFGNNMPSWRRFEETKWRLQDHASTFGIVLKVEEMELQELVSEVKRMRKRGGRNKEWMAFNCMWGLPHMGRRRSRRDVMDFLSVAKDLVANSNKLRGVVTFGDAGGWEVLKNCESFGLFFEKHMEHYQALLESIEWSFPIRLGEARLAMECLFVTPFVTSMDWRQKWEDIKDDLWDFKEKFGFEGLRLSNESLMEAKEMVREEETPFEVRIEGENNNVMVLTWTTTPLLRVSAWR